MYSETTLYFESKECLGQSLYATLQSRGLQSSKEHVILLNTALH